MQPAASGWELTLAHHMEACCAYAEGLQIPVEGV